MGEGVKSISARTGRSLLWSAVESFGASGVAFVVSVIMARFLSPAEFGLIAILYILWLWLR